MDLVANAGWINGVVLPRLRSARDVHRAKEHLSEGMPILGLVETPEGVLAVDEIAAAGVSRLALGTADYSAALGVAPSEALLAYPRTRLVLASAAVGISPPVDGPTLSIESTHELTAETQSARDLGMTGKLCIHPSQVPVVATIFGSSASEVAWAQAILDAASLNDDGVFVVNGEMVDAPVLARARKVLGQ
jgi:citrate lyase subunit beta/citryl-CoA lyase